jgi:hypothetical protein
MAGLGGAMLTGPAQAAPVDLPLINTVISGSTPQSAPHVTFENLMNGTSGVTMLVRGMVGTEFLDALAFNFSGSGALTFTHIGGPAATATFAPNAITLGPVGQGGAGFDVLFDYPNAQGARFDGADVVSVYSITGPDVDQSDFLGTNASGLFAMAHIGSIGANGEGSAFVAAVPEAEAYAMLLAGLGLLGFIMGRRRRSVAPAV